MSNQRQIEWAEVISIESGGIRGKVRLPGRTNTQTVSFTNPVGKGDLVPIAKIHRDPQQRIGIAPQNRIRYMGTKSLNPLISGIWPDVYAYPERSACNPHSPAMNIIVENDWVSDILSFSKAAKFAEYSMWNYWFKDISTWGDYTTHIVKDSTEKEFIYAYHAEYGNIFCINVETGKVKWRHIIDHTKIPSGASTAGYDEWWNLTQFDGILIDENYIYVFINRINYNKKEAISSGEGEGKIWYPGGPTKTHDYYPEYVSAYSYFYKINHNGWYAGCSPVLRNEVIGRDSYFPNCGGSGTVNVWSARSYPYTEPSDIPRCVETVNNDLPYTSTFWYGWEETWYNWDHVSRPWEGEPSGPFDIIDTNNFNDPAGTLINNPWFSLSQYSFPVISQYDGKSYICVSRSGSILNSNLPGQTPMNRQVTIETAAASRTAINESQIIETIIINCQSASIQKIQEVISIYWFTLDMGVPDAGWNVYYDVYHNPSISDPNMHGIMPHLLAIQNQDVFASMLGGLEIDTDDFNFSGIKLRKKSDGSALVGTLHSGDIVFPDRVLFWVSPGAVTDSTKQNVLVVSYHDKDYAFCGIEYIKLDGTSFWEMRGTSSGIIPDANTCPDWYMQNACLMYWAQDENEGYVSTAYWCWIGRKYVSEEIGLRYWQAIEYYADGIAQGGYLLSPIEGEVDYPAPFGNFITENNLLICTKGTAIKIFSRTLELLTDTTLPFSPTQPTSIGNDRLYTLRGNTVKGIK